MSAFYYDDNFGMWNDESDMSDPDMIEFYFQVARQVWCF